MKSKTTLILSFIFIFNSFCSRAQNLVPDSFFVGTGILQTNIGDDQDWSQLIMQPDGKIFCGGYDYSAGGNIMNDMMRFDACGNLDSTFGFNGLSNHTFNFRNKSNCYFLQQDGKYLTAGQENSSTEDTTAIPHVCRYLSNGTPDSSFHGNGSHAIRFDSISSGEFFSTTQLSDGRIYCIGRCTSNINGGMDGIGAMRFTWDGSLDTTFDNDGILYYPHMVVGTVHGYNLHNGKVIAVSASFNSYTKLMAACFDSTGAIDSTFGYHGLFMDSLDTATPYGDNFPSAIQPDEKILMAAVTANTPSPTLEIIRILPTGTLDSSFGLNGHTNLPIVDLSSVRNIKIMSNGSIMLLGDLDPSGTNPAYMFRLNYDGSVDSSFGFNGSITTYFNNNSFDYTSTDLLELPNGQLLLAGDENDLFLEKFTDMYNVPHISISGGHLLQTSGIGYYQWYYNGVEIVGADSSTHYAQLEGDYNVLVTDSSGCAFYSDTFFFSTVNVMNISSATYSIYPNPFTNNITVKNSFNCDIFVYDLFGRKIFEGKNISDVVINTESWRSGIYSMEIISGENRIIRKIIKN
jgi:uncharacterized delta-60 repeat protein